MNRLPLAHRALLLCALSGLVTLVATSCTIKRLGPGEYQVTPAWDDDPSIGGHYYVTEIDGRCYLTNGTWCIPCGGGQLVKCSDILRSGPGPNQGGLQVGLGNAATPEDGAEWTDSEGTPSNDGADDLETTLGSQFYELTGGLDGESFAIVNGLAFWEPGDVVDLPLFVNYFDSDEGILDVSFIWRTNWAQPSVDLPFGVQLEVFLDGNFEDENPETMMFRISGPTAGVEEAVSGMGTDLQITLPNGWTYP